MEDVNKMLSSELFLLNKYDVFGDNKYSLSYPGYLKKIFTGDKYEVSYNSLGNLVFKDIDKKIYDNNLSNEVLNDIKNLMIDLNTSTIEIMIYQNKVYVNDFLSSYSLENKFVFLETLIEDYKYLNTFEMFRVSNINEINSVIEQETNFDGFRSDYVYKEINDVKYFNHYLAKNVEYLV